MGKPAANLNSVNSGHAGYAPTKANSGSSNVNINGNGALRLGDTFEMHLDYDGTGSAENHTPESVSGSGTVKINGKEACRLGDAVGGEKCGGKIVLGSSNVFIG